MNSMKTVPADKPVMLHMPDGSTFRGELRIFYDSDDKDVGGWVCLDEGQAPSDWTDDVCWAQNDDGKPSTRPAGWSHLKEGQDDG